MFELTRKRLCFAAMLSFPLLGFTSGLAADGSTEAGNKKAAMCAACHGKDGLSRRPDVPHIAGQSEIYLKAQLRRFRSGARVHPEMNVVAKNLTDDDIEDLVAWYSNIELEVKLPQ